MGLDPTGGGWRYSFTFWGQIYQGFNCSSDGPTLIDFNAPYLFEVSGYMSCEQFDQTGCDNVTGYVSDIEFTDASGNPLTGVSLVAVPECSSLVLLAACGAAIAFRRRFAFLGRRITGSSASRSRLH